MKNDSGEMMTGDRPSIEDILPLPELKVVRDTYCSQEMTDAIIRHLCEQKRDLFPDLIKWESLGAIRDVSMVGRVYGHVISYLRETPPAGLAIPPTRLGMLDLLYELSRRLRQALKQQEIPVLGKPLAPDREGTYPPLITKPVWKINGKVERVSQELADSTLQLAYQKSPEVFYDYAEQMRRLMKSYEITQALDGLIKDTLPIKQKELWCHIGVYSSLSEMCEFPSYEALKERFNQ